MNQEQITIPVGKGRGESNAKRKVTAYKDGDIVGATAPMLEDGNKGRVMLMKMGWSAGIGLGARNDGMLTPYSQVIKISTSGLR